MAIDLSQYALDSKTGGPFGAIIVKNGNIIGSAGNCVFRDTDPCAHAEIMAIRDACRNIKSLDLSNCEIYTSSEPCPMCMAAIYWAQLNTVYYCVSGTDIQSFGYSDSRLQIELAKPQNKRSVKMIRIPNDNGIKIFKKDTENKTIGNLQIPS